MPYDKANDRDGWKGMQLRNVIFDLNSSDLEGKAFMPRKMSSTQGIGEAWEEESFHIYFGDRLVVQWSENSLQVKRHNWKCDASIVKGLPFAQVGLGLASWHWLAGMKYLQGILLVARRSDKSLWQESPACLRGIATWTEPLAWTDTAVVIGYLRQSSREGFSEFEIPSIGVSWCMSTLIKYMGEKALF